MDLNILGLGLVGSIGLILLAVAVFLKKNVPRNLRPLILYGGIGLLAYSLVVAGGITFAAAPVAIEEVFESEYIGDTSTIYLNTYDEASDTLAEIYPSYHITDKNGNILVDEAAANSTATTVGEILDIYGVSSTSYYMDPILDYQVQSRAPTVKLSGYSVSAGSSMAVTAYDDVMEVLAAGQNDTDYNLTLGASQSKIIYVKIENAQDDKRLVLGAICTLTENSTGIDKYEVIQSGWTKIVMPDDIKDASFSVANGDSSITTDYDDCYAPSSPIVLDEWESITVKTKVTAGSTDPAAYGNIFGLQIVDTGWSISWDNVAHYGIEKIGRESTAVTTVGMAEAITSPFGTTEGFVVSAI